MNKYLVLAGFIVLCLAVGSVSGILTAQSVQEWYPSLNKPFFNPPNWVFGPAWTVLFLMMAVAAWRVWLEGEVAKPALNLFFIQLILNFSWTIIFFGMKNIGLALIEIIVFWIMIAFTLRAFMKISRPAGWMMAPYLAWVTFAATLNASFWWLN